MEVNKLLIFIVILFWFSQQTVLTTKLKCNGKCKCYDTSVDCSAAGLNEVVLYPQLFKKKIKNFDFRRNNIIGLQFSNFSSNNEILEEINFDSNQIDSLNLKKLGHTFLTINKLSFLYNRLKTIEKGDLLFLTNLRYLELGNNQITDIAPGSFFSQEKLEKLFLDNNHITMIEPMTFYGLQNLKILSIKHNRLTLLKYESFKDMSNLEELHLNSNAIQYLEPFDMKWPATLTKIDLSNNRLEYIPNLPSMENFKNDKTLKKWFVDLRKNPVSCDCVLTDNKNYTSSELGTVTCGISVECTFRDQKLGPWATEETCDTPNGMKMITKIKEKPACKVPDLQLGLAKLQNQLTKLECRASGFPNPSVTVQIPDQKGIVSTLVKPGYASVILNKTTESISSFACLGRNIVGNVTSSNWFETETKKRNRFNGNNYKDKARETRCGKINLIFPIVVFTVSMLVCTFVGFAMIWTKCKNNMNSEEDDLNDDTEN